MTKITGNERKLFTVLFFLFFIISLITSITAGILFYLNSYLISAKNFTIKTDKTSEEISNILSSYLYHVDDSGAVQTANIYLSSESIAGIEIISGNDEVVFKDLRTKLKIIKTKELILHYNKIYVGKVKIWFDNKNISEILKNTIVFIFILCFSLVSVNLLLLYLIIKFTFIPSLNKIYLKIEDIAGGLFEVMPDKTKFKEINVIINAVNNMVNQINLKTKKLESNERKYTEIFNSNFVAIFIHDDHGNLIDVNETMLKMFGLKSKEEALTYKIKEDYSSDENNKDMLDDIWKNVIEGKFENFEWIAKRPQTGEIFKVDISLKKILFDERTCILANVLDITEKKNMEEIFLQNQKMEAVGTLSGGLAHEFNNALLSITGSLSLLEIILMSRDNKNEEELNDIINNMKKSTERSALIVQQLMSVSRKQKLSLVELDLKTVIKRVISIARATFDKSINIIFDEPDFIVGVYADANHMEQIFLNLFVNASHALTIMKEKNEKRGGTIEIKVKKIKNDDHILFYDKEFHNLDSREFWMISIIDNGVGIPKNIKNKIFTPFFTTKEVGKGSGLGLSVVYSLIKQHNGHITVQSELEIGTVFNICLPVKDISIKSKEKKITDSKILNRKGTILIVDDENQIRKVLKRILEKFGYIVFEADNGLKAIEIYKKDSSNIDCIILDISMPVISGKEALDEIRKINPDAKIIISSGYNILDQDNNFQDIVAEGYIQKPFDADKLIEEIDKILLPVNNKQAST